MVEWEKDRGERGVFYRDVVSQTTEPDGQMGGGDMGQIWGRREDNQGQNEGAD